MDEGNLSVPESFQVQDQLRLGKHAVFLLIQSKMVNDYFSLGGLVLSQVRKYRASKVFDFLIMWVLK